MQTIIFWLLVAIALLVCAIAGLIIIITSKTQKIKTAEATNKTLFKDYQREAEKRKTAEENALKLGKQVRDLTTLVREQNGVITSLRLANAEYAKRLIKKPTTADYKKAIIKDYKAGADVHDIATKYSLKANTVFKAIARRKAKGDIK